MRIYGQREYMRKLVADYGRDKTKVVSAYARAERAGVVSREKNAMRKTPEEYSDALWRDGKKKGWS